MSVVNLGPIVSLLLFFSWERNVGNKCPVPISLLIICIFHAKRYNFYIIFSKIPHIKVGFFFLKFIHFYLDHCRHSYLTWTHISWLIQWSIPFEYRYKYWISAKLISFINFPKWRTRWSLWVKEKKVLTWTVIFCLTDKEVSLIRSRSQLFANWYHRLLALISWSCKILVPVINGLSDTIYRIINIAPCLRHWIGIESVIDIPSFLVVISQCKWNKIITACKKRPKQPYQVCVLSSKYIRDW